MHDFQYCVWLVTDNHSSKWNGYTNGFQPHITLGSHLTYDEAYKLKEKISRSFIPINVSLTDFEYQYMPDFHALCYKAQPIIDKIPLWWPEDAHVSFYYSYSDIDAVTIKDVKNKIVERNCILDTVQIKLCSGNFENW